MRGLSLFRIKSGNFSLNVVSRGDWLWNPANFKGWSLCLGFSSVTWSRLLCIVSTVLRQWTLFAAVLFAVFQVMACLSSSASDLLQVFTGLPTFLLPCGFHSRACLVVLDVGFRKVWPIQFHLCLAISSGTHSCPVCAQSFLFIFRIFLGHLLTPSPPMATYRFYFV